MKLKKKNTKNLNFPIGDIAIKKDKVCYVCGKKIKETQRYYAIGQKDGVELYRHQKCKARDYKKAL
jgi:hypothetical protein